MVDRNKDLGTENRVQNITRYRNKDQLIKSKK